MAREPIRTDIRDPIREAAADDAPTARKVRRRKGYVDDTYIAPHEIPPGMDYNWKRFTVTGEPQEEYLMAMAENGWEPVPAARHPRLASRSRKDGHIVRGGLILMERPMELTEEARAEDLAEARAQLSIQQRRLMETPAGTMPRDADPRTAARIRQTYEPMQVPDDPKPAA